MPPTPRHIRETKKVVSYLTTRQLLKQYIKMKKLILEGFFSSAHLQERKPQGSGIFYFRINKQYRAWGSYNSDGDFIVGRIDDHQT